LINEGEFFVRKFLFARYQTLPQDSLMLHDPAQAAQKAPQKACGRQALVSDLENGVTTVKLDTSSSKLLRTFIVDIEIQGE